MAAPSPECQGALVLTVYVPDWKKSWQHSLPLPQKIMYYHLLYQKVPGWAGWYSKVLSLKPHRLFSSCGDWDLTKRITIWFLHPTSCLKPKLTVPFPFYFSSLFHCSCVEFNFFLLWMWYFFSDKGQVFLRIIQMGRLVMAGDKAARGFFLFVANHLYSLFLTSAFLPLTFPTQ